MINPNDYLDQLVTLVQTAVDHPDTWNKVYGFRAAPQVYKRYIIVTYMGAESQHGSNTTGGRSVGVDFLIVLFAQHDKTEAAMEAVERDMNEAEYLITKSLLETRDNSVDWMKAIIPFPTNRPRQPREMPETRLAEIPVRLFT